MLVHYLKFKKRTSAFSTLANTLFSCCIVSGDLPFFFPFFLVVVGVWGMVDSDQMKLRFSVLTFNQGEENEQQRWALRKWALQNIVSAVIGEQIEENESLVKVKAREANRNVRAPIFTDTDGATFHSMTQAPLHYCL